MPYVHTSGGDSLIDFEVGHFRNFWTFMTLTLTLDWGHTAYHRVLLIDLYLQTKFRSNMKNISWTDGRTLTPSSLDRLRGRQCPVRVQIP